MQISLAFIATVLSFEALINASPTSALTKRSDVSCNKTYTGDLVLAYLRNFDPNIRDNVPAYLGPKSVVAASVSRFFPSVKVQFDTCTTDGWNVDEETYGQVKLSISDTECLTVIDPESASSHLDFEPCSATRDDTLLQGQWFRAYTIYDGRLFLEATGNPNDPNSIERTDVSFNYYADRPFPNVVSAQPQSSPYLTKFSFANLKTF